MKKTEVKVGGTYTAKVSDRLVPVRIDSAHSKGGWSATNTATGKRIHIKSAQRLRASADSGKKTVTVAATKPKSGASVERAKSTPPKKEAKPKRVSALDAAAAVLKQAGKSMNCKALICVMAERKLWSSPNGKTPHATLNAAMLREIGVKAGESRFKKTGRGLFAFNAETK